MALIALGTVIRRYAWGSHTTIPELLGVAPDSSPQAELWFGAHPLGPSPVDLPGELKTLDKVIEDQPLEMLGEIALERFGVQLPYLLKVLAVDQPLSLQVHPTVEQAERGFAAEEAAGIARDAPSRHYRDEHSKPELVLAYTHFEALVGFRDPVRTVGLVHAIECAELSDVLVDVVSNPTEQGLRRAFVRVLSTPETAREQLVSAVVVALEEYCARTIAAGAVPDPIALRAISLAEHYPDDPGVIAALLMHDVVLEPGEAVFLAAGVLHAYLHGVAIEIQSNSDNVLRGGLTAKPIDIPELLSIVEMSSATFVRPEISAEGARATYNPPIDGFALVVESVESELLIASSGPQLLVCLSGHVSVLDADACDGDRPYASSPGDADRSAAEGLRLTPGQAVFIPASARDVQVVGTGKIVRARTQLG